MKSQQTAITTYSARSRQWDLSHQPTLSRSSETEACTAPQKLPMWLFVADGRRLICRRSVQVVIQEEGGEVIAECDRLHIFAVGDSFDEAVASLHAQVIHFFDEYSSLGEDEVIGRAAEIQQLYRDYFEAAI